MMDTSVERFVRSNYEETKSTQHISIKEIRAKYEQWVGVQESEKKRPACAKSFSKELAKILGPPVGPETDVRPSEGRDDDLPEPAGGHDVRPVPAVFGGDAEAATWSWSGWKERLPDTSHLGIPAEESSVVLLVQRRGFDKCPICLSVVINEAVLTECGHKYCPRCLASLTHTFKCPSCRAPCTKNKSIACTTVFRETKQFSCAGDSCKETNMTLSEFEKHVRYACGDRRIECDCGEVVPASDWKEHIEELHPSLSFCQCGQTNQVKRPHECFLATRPCPRCGEVLPANEFSSHWENSCAKATVCGCCGLPGPLLRTRIHETTCSLSVCSHCNSVFRSDKLGKHETRCPAKIFACPDTECTFRGHLAELASHLEDGHPRLEDTGVHGSITDNVFAVRDRRGLLCLAMEVEADPIQMNRKKYSFIGWRQRHDEWVDLESVPKRVFGLEEKMEELIKACRTSCVLSRVFSKESVVSLTYDSSLTHTDLQRLMLLQEAHQNSN